MLQDDIENPLSLEQEPAARGGLPGLPIAWALASGNVKKKERPTSIAKQG